MSIKDGKITFSLMRGRSKIVVGLLTCVQGVLSLVLCVSLAAHIIWPEKTLGASGSPLQIAYEGRLTDSSGNALGGTGTAYCFRFSIYDASTAGNKLWPAAATPTATLATSTDGVFNAIIGQADTLSSTVFDFSTTSSAYLQVDVSSSAPTCSSGYESLSPRQQLLASPYAMTANNINYLRSDTANSKAQVGTNAGAGGVSPIYLALDVKNSADYVGQSCSTSGLMWYNSATSHALICEGGFIQAVGNSTTTIAAMTANGSVSAATAGTVNFNNANGVTFGINGNTITASVAAAGAANTVSFYENFPYLPMTSAISYAQSVSQVVPFMMPYNISASYIRMPITMGAASTAFTTGVANTSFTASIMSTLVAVIYSLGTGANSRSLQSVASGSVGFTQLNSMSINANSTVYSLGTTISYPFEGGTSSYTTGYTNSSATLNFSSNSYTNFTGVRYLDIPFNNSLAPGQYWMAYGQSTSVATQVAAASMLTGARMTFNNYVITQPSLTYLRMGNISATNNYGYLLAGSFTTAGGVISTASLNLTNISSSASQPTLYFQMIRQS
jgi:hypothetical protein